MLSGPGLQLAPCHPLGREASSLTPRCQPSTEEPHLRVWKISILAKWPLKREQRGWRSFQKQRARSVLPDVAVMGIAGLLRAAALACVHHNLLNTRGKSHCLLQALF